MPRYNKQPTRGPRRQPYSSIAGPLEPYPKPVVFRGEDAPLSNFYTLEAPIQHQGTEWQTTEHAYKGALLAKHNLLPDATIAEMQYIPPRRLGRYCQKLLDTAAGPGPVPGKQWEQAKLAVMDELMALKYEASPAYRDAVLTAGEFKEDTSHPFWAQGTLHRPGANQLGNLHGKQRAQHLRGHLVIIGDSHARGRSPATTCQRHLKCQSSGRSTVVDNFVQITVTTLFNPGAKTQFIHRRCLHQGRDLVPSDATHFVLVSGTNDLGKGNSAQQIVADLQAFKAELNHLYPQARVFITPLIPGVSNQAKVWPINQTMKEEMPGDVVGGNLPLTRRGKQRSAMYDTDRTHLSAAGQQILYKRITTACFPFP